MGQGEGQAGGSIWKVEGGLRGEIALERRCIILCPCTAFFPSFVVSYRIVSLFPCPQASSSVRQSAILTSISIITLILTLTLHHIPHTLAISTFQDSDTDISHHNLPMVIRFSIFDFFFDSDIHRSFGLSNDYPLLVCVQCAHSANLAWCLCQRHHPSPSNVDIPCTTLFTVFLSASLTFAFSFSSLCFFFSLLSLLACYVITISSPKDTYRHTVRCSANIVTAGVHAEYSEQEKTREQAVGMKYVCRCGMKRKSKKYRHQGT